MPSIQDADDPHNPSYRNDVVEEISYAAIRYPSARDEQRQGPDSLIFPDQLVDHMTSLHPEWKDQHTAKTQIATALWNSPYGNHLPSPMAIYKEHVVNEDGEAYSVGGLFVWKTRG